MTCFLSLAAVPAAAQTSIIEEMQNARAGVVAVSAVNRNIYKSPGELVRDPKTGRIFLARKLARAAYQRDGAGVIVDPSGIIVTNAHTIYEAQQVAVTLNDGSRIPARVLRLVKGDDIALLKIPPHPSLFTVPIADSDRVKLGDEVITIGSSSLLKKTISGGTVIGLGHSRGTGNKVRNNLIQTTINVYKGDSGGPLFDRHGRLIGLITASEEARDRSSFAVPSNDITRYLSAYLKQTNQSKGGK